MTRAKTPEAHLNEAKQWTLTNLKVIGPAKRFKNSRDWFVLCECLNCGKYQWIAKRKLRHTNGCGCSKWIRPEVTIEKVELTEEQKAIIDRVLKDLNWSIRTQINTNEVKNETKR